MTTYTHTASSHNHMRWPSPLLTATHRYTRYPPNTTHSQSRRYSALQLAHHVNFFGVGQNSCIQHWAKRTRAQPSQHASRLFHEFVPPETPPPPPPTLLDSTWCFLFRGSVAYFQFLISPFLLLEQGGYTQVT